MGRSRKTDVLAAIDFGTDCIRTVIAEAEDDSLDIIGVGQAKSTGLKRGVVINIESTVNAIREAVEEAELMAGREVVEAYANITGSHIRGMNKSGVVSVGKREVRPDDVGRVLKAARAVKIEAGRDFVHVLPIDFAVDDNYGLRGPVGIAGVRLETNVHIVTAARSALDNVTTCCNREGIRVNNLVFSPLAASQTLLHEDEKELGVVLADVGAGVTEFVVWFNGSVIQTGVIPIGGDVITNELAVALRTPRAEAEQIKLKYGVAMASMVPEDDTIEVPAVGGRPPQTKSRRLLADVAEPVLEEIFTAVAEQIQRAGNEERVSSGMVLTGGSSRMEGICDLGEQILGIPVRNGALLDPGASGATPYGGVTSAVSDPAFGVALGMVLLASKEDLQHSGSTTSPDDGTWHRFKKWLREAFV